MIFQTKAKVIKNIEVAPKYYKIVLSCDRMAKVVKPGQFVQVKASGDFEPLLRRPFSIHRIDGGNLEIFYEMVGKATEILSHKKAGEYLDVIGPLGNGFNLSPITYHLSPILVAGGMGVAPLIFLAEKLRKFKITVLIGARKKSHILCEKEFKNLGCKVKIATDDGSAGFRGKVTELLKSILQEKERKRERKNEIYACGPRLMLKEISQISKYYDIPAQVSLEEHMACGFGACLGCVVKTRLGFKRVCNEGPVFDAGQLIW